MKNIILFLFLFFTQNITIAEHLPEDFKKDCLVSISDTQMINVKYLESIDSSIFDKNTTYINLTSGNKLVIPNKNSKKVLVEIMGLIKKECQ